MTDLYILAGEPSGDLQGSHLLEAVYSRAPHLSIAGVAGPRMRMFPIQCAIPMEELQVMGFIDVFKALPRLLKQFCRIRNEILRLQPRAVVCIDYPGFNIRLERSLRRHGYKGRLIHYICPTVWAWGKGRIPIMAQNLDLLLTIFPFEKKHFAHTSLPIEYVGHPLIKKVREHRKFEHFKEHYAIKPAKKILAIFPGSRKTEIERNFPLQMQAARRLQALTTDMEIAVSLAHPNLRNLLSIPGIRLIEPQHHYDLMQNSHLALATSGTVTLEIALFQTPAVVNFAIKPLDVFIAQKILRINLRYYAMPNILAGKEIFPELFGPHLTGDSLFRKTRQFWFDQDTRTTCQADCMRMREMLGDENAAEKAAAAIFHLIY